MDDASSLKTPQSSSILDFLRRHENEEEKASQPQGEEPKPVAREVNAAEAVCPTPFPSETVHLANGFTLLRGSAKRTSPGLASLPWSRTSDLVPGQYEGGFKLWESSVDLVEALRKELEDGPFSFQGKDVLELGCGHGLPGILACLKGAASVHFQDFNAEVLLRLTIPNVEANVTAAAPPAATAAAAAEAAAAAAEPLRSAPLLAVAPHPPSPTSHAPKDPSNMSRPMPHLMPDPATPAAAAATLQTGDDVNRGSGPHPSAGNSIEVHKSTSGQSLSASTPTATASAPRARTRFFAGDWDDVSNLLSSNSVVISRVGTGSADGKRVRDGAERGGVLEKNGWHETTEGFRGVRSDWRGEGGEGGRTVATQELVSECESPGPLQDARQSKASRREHQHHAPPATTTAAAAAAFEEYTPGNVNESVPKLPALSSEIRLAQVPPDSNVQELAPMGMGLAGSSDQPPAAAPLDDAREFEVRVGPLADHQVLDGSPALSSKAHGGLVERTLGSVEGQGGGTGGYDVILTAETVYSVHSLPKLLNLMKKCLRRPYGVVYFAGKKYYFGVGGGTRKFLDLIHQDGTFQPKIISELADGASNVREVWKLTYMT